MRNTARPSREQVAAPEAASVREHTAGSEIISQRKVRFWFWLSHFRFCKVLEKRARRLTGHWVTLGKPVSVSQGDDGTTAAAPSFGDMDGRFTEAAMGCLGWSDTSREERRWAPCQVHHRLLSPLIFEILHNKKVKGRKECTCHNVHSDQSRR